MCGRVLKYVKFEKMVYFQDLHDAEWIGYKLTRGKSSGSVYFDVITQNISRTFALTYRRLRSRLFLVVN